jgi:Ca2+/Na+ antiporter
LWKPGPQYWIIRLYGLRNHHHITIVLHESLGIAIHTFLGIQLLEDLSAVGFPYILEELKDYGIVLDVPVTAVFALAVTLALPHKSFELRE